MQWLICICISLLYCYLCNRADRNGECYPSVRLIAKDLNLARSTVFLAFHELEQNGLLQRLPRYHPSGARRSNLYRLKGEITRTGGGAVHPHRGGGHNV